MTSSTFFWDWMMEGQYDGRARSLDVTVVQRRPNPDGPDPIFKPVKKWLFKNCFPVSWKVKDLTVTDANSVAMETLELSFDYMELS
jgi:phage tail-like protein